MQPQAQPQPQPQAQPLPQPEPHRPPQAYPAPPVTPPTAGAAGPVGGQGAGQVGPSVSPRLSEPHEPLHLAGMPGQAGAGYDAGPAAPGAGAAGEHPVAAPGGGQGHGPASAAGSGGDAVRRPRTGARTVPRTRKARLRVAKTDPWSVMKVSFLLSIALGVCTIVAVSVLWMVMNAMGVFSAIGGTLSQATESGEGGFDLESFLSLPRVLLFTSVIAAIDVVLATALATLGAFIYNISAGFVGGVEITLAEDE
ncbi:hypothetical protein GCM10012287_25400 [Streptomyces daqingensis]|uniref:DUF3566 domain-containing protein n=2 Tax=Streptomyces daqingensis TaxID=1472640 RepID=A0ABQ2MAG6_9ACTN|nr:hypothetical protein GCM10012287_25400 [Streptomyces daqingensis]